MTSEEWDTTRQSWYDVASDGMGRGSSVRSGAVHLEVVHDGVAHDKVGRSRIEHGEAFTPTSLYAMAQYVAR